MIMMFLFSLIMIAKAVEIRTHLYLPDKDTFLIGYRRDFIIYDGNSFLKFLSLAYAFSGFLIMVWTIIASMLTSYTMMIIQFILVLTFIQIFLKSIGKKYFKKRFS